MCRRNSDGKDNVCKECMRRKATKQHLAYLRNKRRNPESFRLRSISRHFENPEEARAMMREALDRPCRYCQDILTYKMMSLDHRLPSSRGGRNSQENFQIICKRCNTRKGDFSDTEYAALLGMLRNYPELEERLLRRLGQAGFMYRG